MAKTTIDQTIIYKAELLVKQLDQIAEAVHKARVTIGITVDKLKGPTPDYPGLSTPFMGDLCASIRLADKTNSGLEALLCQLIDDRDLT